MSSDCHADAHEPLIDAADAKSTTQPDKKRLLARLNRIEGQVRGIGRMVEADRYCVDILTQLAALRAALDAVAMQLLENHAHGCVSKAISAGQSEEAIEELMEIVRKLKS